MRIFYSPHAKMRMGQKGITELEVEHILAYPDIVRKSYLGREIAYGKVKNKLIRVIFIRTEQPIIVVTIR